MGNGSSLFVECPPSPAGRAAVGISHGLDGEVLVDQLANTRRPQKMCN
jgi:hypothetical protein